MSTQQTTGCPAPERLRELLSGELAASEQEALTRHIETCGACQTTLDGWLSSPSVEGLAAAGADSATHDAALRDLMAQLRKKSTGAPTEAETIAPQSPQGAPTPPASESLTQVPGVQTEALAFLAAATPPGQPARLGHYQIRGVVGQGGFGVVLKAFDEKLERIVAIKALLPAYAAVGSARKRFVREARTAAAVKNEHVVAIYGVQDDAQPPYLVMELIDGISLQDKLDKNGPLPVKEILRIGMQTAEGLAAAHKQGLVHRDIKPANILLENGVERVKLTDFGLARAVDDASMTQSGTVAGTPVYMSPEQAGGLAIDHRSDLFSLGTVLYALCTGHPPFRGSGTHAVLMRVIEDTPRPIREVNNEIPDWLSDIIAKLHAKKAENRFQTAKEVAELLGQHLAHLQQPGSVPAPAPVVLPARVSMAGTSETLVEGSDRARRLLQHGLSTVVLLLGLAGMLMLLVGPPELRWPAIADLVAAGVLLVGVARIKQRWTTEYRGHRIRFENSCVTGESLFIDDVRVARGGVGLRNEVRAMIRHGEGAGEEAVVFAESGLFSFHCRIVVEHSPSLERSARLAFAAKVQRWLAAGVGVAAAVMVVVAVSLATWLSNRTFPVTLQMDDPDIVVRIWPTAQTSPPVNLAGGFEMLGDPAHVIKNSNNTLLFLPSGHYWLTAKLDGQEVERIFFHVLSKSLQTHHIEVVGQNVTAAGHFVVGQPKVINVPGAARLLQKEKKRLQGAWHAVAAVMDGKPMPKEMIEQVKPRIVFNGDRVSMTQNMPGNEKIDETYTLNPRNKPATLDIPKGFKNRDTMLAIYRWDGPNTLVICAGPQGRPNEFESTPGSERVLFTLLRENGVTTREPEPGWVQLFNGTDLTGWVAPQPGSGDWQVDKFGQLVGKGDPRSYLFTQRDDFTDFHLRTELQVGGGSAGGICFRSGLNRLPLQLAPGYKASLSTDPPIGSLLLTLPESKGGEFIAKASKTEFKASTWFTTEVIARGNHLTVKIDGKTVADYTDDKATYTKGRIALETYLPGTSITFKKVEIKELPPAYKDDRDRLQGEWAAVSMEVAGVQATPELLAKLRITFTGKRYRFFGDGLQGDDGEFQLDEKANPKTIDLSSSEAGLNRYGIYKFDGDRLVLCVGEDLAKDRPTEFSSKGGNKRWLLVLKWVNATEPGWVSLFNGKDLSGWRPPADKSWQIEDNILVARGEGPGSLLLTNRDDYEDFQLRLETKVNAKPNVATNWVHFRARDDGSSIYVGYDGRDWVFGTVGDDVKPGTFSAIQPQPPATPQDAWFVLEILAKGPDVVFKVNGKPAAKAEGLSVRRGRIGIDLHPGPGAVVSYKKIEIKELPAAPPTLPKKAADIPRFVAGTWKMESTIIEPKLPADQAKMTGFNVFEPIAGGKFLRGYSNYGNGQFESLMVQNYDEATDSVKGWFFSSKGENHGPGVGRWNAESRTMLWLEKLPSGLHAAYEFQFADVNTIKTKVYYQNDKNEIVFELRGNGTRLPGPVDIKPAPIDPKRPAEMKIFDTFIGEWDTAGTMKTKDMPGGFKFTTHLKSRSMLGGRVVETKETGLPGQDDLYWLMTYDTSLKAYRSWLFNGAGEVMTLGGGWDQKSGTLKWNEAKPDGSTAASTWRMVNPDRWEWNTLIKDAVGNTLFDLQATKTRKVPPGQKLRPKPAEELPPKVRDVVDKGLDYLAKEQHQDGHWEGVQGAHPTSLTALAGMTMLMEGSTLQEGKYAESLRKAVDWMMAQSQANGLLSTPGEKGLYMFGHGYGMLFLSTVHGTEEDGDRRRMLEKILRKAVEFTADAQANSGGWGYVRGRDGNQFDESATTICQLQALRAARNAGIVVPRKLIDADYLRKCTTAKGGVIYSIVNGKEGERPGLTAAALAAGEYDSDLAKKWLKMCQTLIPLDGKNIGFDEYTHYYYAQALYLLGDNGYAKFFPQSKADERLTWSKYRAAMFDPIVSKQAADGSWKTSPLGEVYSTASWLTVLQLDRAFVPIYQR